jgi:hypothetical protein
MPKLWTKVDEWRVSPHRSTRSHGTKTSSKTTKLTGIVRSQLYGKYSRSSNRAPGTTLRILSPGELTGTPQATAQASSPSFICFVGRTSNSWRIAAPRMRSFAPRSTTPSDFFETILK